ncbi:hypothetical protein ACFW1F_00370 [Streptomyces bungoensis]|uniref:hypothetical protein n=1 Tax=Streptomyces bungoensis TaxID=285568 RepID=UPI00343BE8B2
MDEDDADAALQAALDQPAFATRSAAALSSTLDAVEGLRRVCRVMTRLRQRAAALVGHTSTS